MTGVRVSSPLVSPCRFSASKGQIVGARSIHPFPARMAPEIALNAIPGIKDGARLTVLDPMCGSGTVLAAAISRGQSALGFDIDPLAVLMSSVATVAVSGEEMLAAAEEVLAAANERDCAPPWSPDDHETDTFASFWFGDKQRRDLIALSSAIHNVAQGNVRSALQVALSRIIVTKTPQASLAADTSHSRPHRVMRSSDYDVRRGFQRSVQSLERMLTARTILAPATVRQGDSRRLNEVEAASVDLVITSPPYLNALDYMRGHKLALIWFGHSVKSLRALRANSIGAERRPDKAVGDGVDALVEFIKSDVADRAVLRDGMLRRFAGDMVTFAHAVRRVVKSESRVVLVVGNSTLRGNYIRNDVIAQRALEEAGFSLLERTEREIPATKRYLAINTRSQDSSLRNRMRSEIVLTMDVSA